MMKKYQPTFQSVLLLSCCISTIVLMGMVVNLKNTVAKQTSSKHHAHEGSELVARKMTEKTISRQKRAIGDPRMTTLEAVGGAIYIRWGRLECPADTELVYKGSVAGSHSGVTGGGSEYLCVTHDVEWERIDNNKGVYSRLYGAEFAGSGPDAIFDHDNAETLVNHDAVCSACRSKVRTTQLMIPGRMSCPGGWVMEYHGYLMSSGNTAKSQHNYICVDRAPKGDQGGFKAEGGAQLWPVEAYCGSLPCPNYVQGRELTCVVCTK